MTRRRQETADQCYAAPLVAFEKVLERVAARGAHAGLFSGERRHLCIRVS